LIHFNRKEVNAWEVSLRRDGKKWPNTNIRKDSTGIVIRKRNNID